MAISLRRTTSDDPDFIALTGELDRQLQERYGAIQAQYAPLNVLPSKTYVIVASDGRAVGCGGFKEYAPGTAELKRMFVQPDQRGRGIAIDLVAALEAWARELGFTTMILETGDRQHEAIALYHRLGFTDTPKYAPYVDMPVSICMRKSL